MQRLATLATLALATHGLSLGGATAEADDLTLAELLDKLFDEGICSEEMLAQKNLDLDAYELA